MAVVDFVKNPLRSVSGAFGVKHLSWGILLFLVVGCKRHEVGIEIGDPNCLQALKSRFDRDGIGYRLDDTKSGRIWVSLEGGEIERIVGPLGSLCDPKSNW